MLYNIFNPDPSFNPFNQPKIPQTPFQIVFTDRDYCSRYCLPSNTMVTVTHVRYCFETKQTRFSLLGALFDFPWEENHCQIVPFCYSN